MGQSKYNKTIYVSDDEFWQKVKDKCDRPDINRSVSQIVTRLLKMWIDDEVMPYPEKEFIE